STTMTIRPRRISSTASSIVVNGGSGDTTRGSGVTRRRFWVAISLKSRGALSLLGDALHVFRDDVDLDVHGISWPQRAERGALGGVGDERDLEERLPEARDGQAHAIDGDEALHDDVALEALRQREAEAPAVTVRLPRQQLRLRVYVALYEVTSE